MTPNVAAFLEMTAKSEGVIGRVDVNGVPIDPYRICYSPYRNAAGMPWRGYIIRDLSDHPCVSRPGHAAEWAGESLASLGPSYAHSISTAAGKYQITRPTWQGCQAILGLNDFTGPSQDDAAILLIKQKGALDLINGGRVADAVTMCRDIWASLPGSAAGQPQTRFADLMKYYGDAGGGFA